MKDRFSVDAPGGTVRARWHGDYGGFGRAELAVRADGGHEMRYAMRFPDAETRQATARVSSRDWYDGVAYGSTIDDAALDDLERVADLVADVTGGAAVFTGPENRGGRERIRKRLGTRYDVRAANATRIEANGAGLADYADIVARVAPGLRDEVVDGGVLEDAAAHLADAYREARDRPGWMR